MAVLRFVRGLIGVACGGTLIWAGVTNQPQVADRQSYALGLGAVAVLFGLWRMSKAFQQEKK